MLWEWFTLLEGCSQAFVVITVEVSQEPGLALQQLNALSKAVHQEGRSINTLPLLCPAPMAIHSMLATAVTPCSLLMAALLFIKICPCSDK